MADQIMDVLEDVKQEAFEEGWEEGMEKGKEEGLEQEKFFATRNMLRKGLDVNIITSVLEITETYVQEVENQLKKEADVASLLKEGKLDIQEMAVQLKVSPHLVQIVKRDLEKGK